MERKHTPVYGIKGKLISAVCMLLVAVIMVVSSTYAWFTLSTAPEVTGISTAIGANGALEIKLNGNVDGTTIKNTTFGNLVDLTDTVYGLQAITLLPSTIDLTGNILDPNFLMIPKYGADGRPETELSNNVVTGIYNTDKFVPTSSTAEELGVRGVGVASGLTERQLAYRNAKASASTAMTQAKNAATTSLNTNGSALADIVVKKASGKTEFTKADVNALNAVVTDLNKEGGILDFIEEAYLQQILALAASANTDTVAGTNGDLVFTYVKSNLGTIITLETIAANDGFKAEVTGVTNGYTFSISGTKLLEGIEAFLATKAAVEEANVKLNGTTDPATTGIIGSTDYNDNKVKWSDISAVVNALINPEYVYINDYASNSIMGGANQSAFVNSVVSQGINVSMKGTNEAGGTDGAGVYEQIADQCGNFNASIKINIDYNGMKFENMDARMKTETNQNTPYLEASQAIFSQTGYGAPSNSSSTEVIPMTEFYGYILDFIFQTNAAQSDLLLQVDGVDRIYEDNQNEETMGGGSYMTFASTSASFSNDQVKELMKAIRIVFFDTTSRTVLGYAKLDVAGSTVGADGVTAKMYMYEALTGTTKTFKYTPANGTETTETYYYVAGTTAAYYTTSTFTGEPFDTSAGTVSATANADGSYTFTPTAGGETTNLWKKEATNEAYYKVTDGVVAKDASEKLGDGVTAFANVAEASITTANDVTLEKKLTGDDAVITSLAQNTPVSVSTLVYLEGDPNKGGVTNASVAATGSKSVTGSMNIQFSSSATLTPMEYGDLHTPAQTTP